MTESKNTWTTVWVREVQAWLAEIQAGSLSESKQTIIIFNRQKHG